MNKFKKFWQHFAGKGYYIALVLCAAAIGITGYLYYRNASDPALNDPALNAGDSDLQAMATKPSADPSTDPSTDPSADPSDPEKPKLKTCKPVEGETALDYAMDRLCYNPTTRDWRVHNGIDLAAEEGAAVVAAADGEVYTVYEDETLGNTVVIRHNDGYTTRYCSLSDEIAVKAGDPVTMGQTIGYAGDSAIVESTLGSHVHFSVSRYDQPMDPAEFLSLGQ